MKNEKTNLEKAILDADLYFHKTDLPMLEGKNIASASKMRTKIIEDEKEIFFDILEIKFIDPEDTMSPKPKIYRFVGIVEPQNHLATCFFDEKNNMVKQL